MKIGIIGTGNIGGTFARKLSAVGHQTPAALKVAACLLAKSEQKPRHGAVVGAEVIILAIPVPAMRELPADLFD